MARQRADEREGIARETREKLLRAAVDEFAEAGCEAANINRISLAAGFAKGTVYNYFKDKRALVLAAIDSAGAAHVGYVIERMRSEPSPAERLARFFAAGFEYVERNPAPSRFVLSVLFGVDEELRERLGAAYGPLSAELRNSVLEPGMRGGAFRRLVAAEAAKVIMTLYLGAASQVDAKGRPYLDPISVADYALRAVAAQGGEG
jgi:AcrR family transcriptional regulator